MGKLWQKNGHKFLQAVPFKSAFKREISSFSLIKKANLMERFFDGTDIENVFIFCAALVFLCIWFMDLVRFIDSLMELNSHWYYFTFEVNSKPKSNFQWSAKTRIIDQSENKLNQSKLHLISTSFPHTSQIKWYQFIHQNNKAIA